MRSTWLLLSIAAVSSVASPVTDSQSTGAKDVLIQTVSFLAELRAVTPAEKTRAALFNFEGLPPLIQSKTVHHFPGLQVVDPPSDNPLENDPLWKVACRSSAIVYGNVEKGRALLSGDESSLFTDYSVQVAQWIKPDRGKASILVTASGGAVRVGDTVLRATTETTILTSRSYLFFLRVIPNGDAYGPLGAPLLLSEGRVVGGPLSDQGPQDAQKTKDQILRLLKQCKTGVEDEHR
jgi:hypothetical protein